MADEQNEPDVEFEFLSPLDDAAIRLDCFRLTARGATDFTSHLQQANTLYTWVMDFNEEEADGLGLATTEAECTRKY